MLPTTYRPSQDGCGYSPLDQTSAHNAADLAPIWVLLIWMRVVDGSGTGIRTPVPWLRTTYPNP